MKILFSLFAALVLLPTPTLAQNDAVDLDMEIERMMEAVGGREVWANATGFYMSEILHDAGQDLPIFREYWIDFETPRIYARSHGRNIELVQVLNVDEGWTVSRGELRDWPAEEVEDWSSFWPGIPTRVFHMIASEDPDLDIQWRDGVMDVFYRGNRVVWIATNDDGLPVAYGRENRHSDTHFLGEMLTYGDVNLWSEATEPTGDWRVVMLEYKLYTGPMPDRYIHP